MQIQIPLQTRQDIAAALAEKINRHLDAGAVSMRVIVPGNWPFRADKCRVYCQARQPGKLTTAARLLRYDGTRPLQITESGHPHGAAMCDESWTIHTDDDAAAREISTLVEEHHRYSRLATLAAGWDGAEWVGVQRGRELAAAQ